MVSPSPYSNRPFLGLPVAFCAASETCAFPASAKLDFEVQPGEIVEISPKGIRSVCQVPSHISLVIFLVQMKPASPQAMCIFEYVYFARSDTLMEGQQVQTVREECGKILAEESHVEADLVANVGFLTYLLYK